MRLSFELSGGSLNEEKVVSELSWLRFVPKSTSVILIIKGFIRGAITSHN